MKENKKMETKKFFGFIGIWVLSYFIFNGLGVFENFEVIVGLLLTLFISLGINVSQLKNNDEAKDMLKEDFNNSFKKKENED